VTELDQRPRISLRQRLCLFHPRCPRRAALPVGDDQAEVCRTMPVPVLPAVARDSAGTSLVACHLSNLDVPALVEQSGTTARLRR
jgi:hypothetical protein